LSPWKYAWNKKRVEPRRVALEALAGAEHGPAAVLSSRKVETRRRASSTMISASVSRRPEWRELDAQLVAQPTRVALGRRSPGTSGSCSAFAHARESALLR